MFPCIRKIVKYYRNPNYLNLGKNQEDYEIIVMILSNPISINHLKFIIITLNITVDNSSQQNCLKLACTFSSSKGSVHVLEDRFRWALSKQVSG